MYRWFTRGVGLIALPVVGFLIHATISEKPLITKNLFESFLPQPEAVVLFGGDVLFDRSIRVAAEEKGGDFIFSCIAGELRKADLAVVNLEGPITDHPSKSVGSLPGGTGNYTFTFPPTTARLLYDHNIRTVNLGNNHIENFHADGVDSTMQYLDAAGVAHFGDPLRKSVSKQQIGGVKLAFINYNEFDTIPSATTLSQIKEARETGYLPVVYTHWGVEYKEMAPQYVVDLARRFVDAGAEIVIGSHPHVIENSELYKGRHIYYSLGNFIFDQYWNDAVRTGLILSVTFSDSGVKEVHEQRIFLERDRRTCLKE